MVSMFRQRFPATSFDMTNFTKNAQLVAWVHDTIQQCKPDSVYVCDGSHDEYIELCEELVRAGIFTPVKGRAHSYWTRTTPTDVARLESRTFICSTKKDDAGPTNNWRDPKEMMELLNEKFDGSMRGRTLFVVPFSMGPLGSELSAIGVELTDSAYVAVNMKIMTRMGKAPLERLTASGVFVPCLHSVGAPLAPGDVDSVWPSNEDKYIVHFPERRAIYSFGSGYGGNALLSKKCFALRIASVMARDEGWFAEHMLISKVTPPNGAAPQYVCAAFPSACGKTNLAMLSPTLPGWKVEVVGDDIAWLKPGRDGRLYAINPENGFFGVAPGTSMRTNKNAMLALEENVIFTNTGLLVDSGDVWWEGMGVPLTGDVIDWKGALVHPPQPPKTSPVAHPNARFTAPVGNCPIVDEAFNRPEGVPISAIIFGGRRPSTVPLVMQSFDWTHGTLMGAMVSSEQTAAVVDRTTGLRHDPFAMLPFCGYNMGDYFAHWLRMGTTHDPALFPKIFHVNWFRVDAEQRFVWPGFGDNIRVLAWILGRVAGTARAIETPIGLVPHADDINVDGLDAAEFNLPEALRIDTNEWLGEIKLAREYFAMFGSRFPAPLAGLLDKIEQRLGSPRVPSPAEH